MKTKCKNCNNPFKPSRPSNLYCCKKCKSIFYEKNVRQKRSKKHKLKIQQQRKDEQNSRQNKGVFIYEEIGYIVMNYNIKTLGEISIDLDRTKQSIESKIRLLKKNNILTDNSNLKD